MNKDITIKIEILSNRVKLLVNDKEVTFENLSGSHKKGVRERLDKILKKIPAGIQDSFSDELKTNINKILQ